jgi:cytochrome oxidase Cu insertion factor (SCO1/SenC/PrrC family)
MGMFIVDKDGDEMDVVEISVDPDHLQEHLGKYEHHHSDSDADGDKSN